MIVRQESGTRWLAVRIGDFEKWQASLLEESASRLGAVLDPGGRVHRWGFCRIAGYLPRPARLAVGKSVP